LRLSHKRSDFGSHVAEAVFISPKPRLKYVRVIIIVIIMVHEYKAAGTKY